MMIDVLSGKVKIYRGTFARFSFRSAGMSAAVKDTVLLTNVHDLSGKGVRQHCWFDADSGFDVLKPRPGDEIEFDGQWTFDRMGLKLRIKGKPRLVMKC